MNGKNTDEVTHYFNNINEKQNCKFTLLDIQQFYPSISEETWNKANNFAKNYTSISQENIWIIKYCRKSLLLYNNEPWKKKEQDGSFDVTMGSYDGAQLCELIGIYIQCLLENTLEEDLMGLYRDDWFIILCNTKRHQTDKIWKKIISIFKNIDFKIEVTNLMEVEFLDVTFNLERNTYRPYKKPNDNLTPHKIIHHKSLNASLKTSVKDYLKILQVLKYLNNLIQIMTKQWKKYGYKAKL